MTKLKPFVVIYLTTTETGDALTCTVVRFKHQKNIRKRFPTALRICEFAEGADPDEYLATYMSEWKRLIIFYLTTDENGDDVEHTVIRCKHVETIRKRYPSTLRIFDFADFTRADKAVNYLLTFWIKEVGLSAVTTFRADSVAEARAYFGKLCSALDLDAFGETMKGCIAHWNASKGDAPSCCRGRRRAEQR